MKRKLSVAAMFLFLAFLVWAPVRADAAWKKTGSTYTWYNNKGKKLSSEWIPSKKAGFVKKGKTTYCYKKNGKVYKGWLTVGKDKYYVTPQGKVLTSRWISSGGKRYFASKQGKVYRSCRVKIGSYYYGFNSKGVMLTGKSKVKGKTYYFYKKNGRMVKNAFVTIKGKKYYFGSNGVLGKNVWVKNYYINSSGCVSYNTWVGDKYVGSDGHPVKGLKKIGGSYYYFDKSSGKKLVNATKTVDGVTYKFNSAGKGTVVKDTDKPSVSVQSTYYSDPQVDDETLLAAIIYCEAGNQPYYGQVAVGMVITNRMRSSSFPSKLKEVVYQTSQFSPTFDGALTRALKNRGLIIASCKKAAAEVMTKYKTNNYKIQVNGKTVNLKNYLFFMTKPAYNRLNLSTSYTQLGDHVFFKTWK